jgi:hypothetical protein
MTRKNYIAIAKILAGQFATAAPAEKGAIWCLTLSMADYFKQDNANFDRSKFYTAVMGSPDHFAVRDEFQALAAKHSDARRSEVI